MISDADAQRAINHAKMIWLNRENEMWGPGHHFAKQTWEQGTDIAKRTTLAQAMRELGLGD